MDKDIKLLDNVYFVQHGKIYTGRVESKVHTEGVTDSVYTTLGSNMNTISITDTYFVRTHKDIIELDSSDVFKTKEDLIKSVTED